MHEDLSLVPMDLGAEANCVYIEGDLNPEVRWIVDNVYRG